MEMSHRDSYVWDFSEDLLVLQSSHSPRAVLTLIYLDARNESRRIVNGELVLDGDARTVNRIKVCHLALVLSLVSSFLTTLPTVNKTCRNILLVEFTTEREGGIPGWLGSVDCFRLSLSLGNSGVIATKVSSFDTFEFDDDDHSKWTMGGHSGKYYAVYSEVMALLQIWDIETGKVIRRIPKAEFPKILRVVGVMVIAKQGPDGPQQVVVAGGDGERIPRPSWGRISGDWGDVASSSVTDFAVFPIEAGSPGSPGWTGSVEEHKKQQGRPRSPPREAPVVATLFRAPRCPAGITSLDTPDTPGCLSEEVGLRYWDWGEDTENVYSFCRSITPDRPLIMAPDVPLVVEHEFRMAVKWRPRPPPFAVGSRSGLSLTIDFTGCHEHFEGHHQRLSRLCVRSFYPSTTPGVMDLEWESPLRSSNDRGETRRLFCLITYVCNRYTTRPFLIDENELGTAFLEPVEGGVDLVLLLWDDRFHGELPRGTVLN